MGVLHGVRVLDLGVLVQAPQAAATLHDLGAEVIKIELPEMGDLSRAVPVSLFDDLRSAFYTASNRGKRSVTLDLRTAAGAEAFLRLADSADVVISNFKPGTMDEWGLGYSVLRERNPRLIWAAGSSFGHLGPDAQMEGADLAGQARGGLISTIGRDGSEATPAGVTVADHIASQNLTIGVLAALMAREQTGYGQRVEVSLLGGQVWAQASELTHYALGGVQHDRANRGHGMIPSIYGIFPTADGWIAMIGVPPHLKEAFCEALDRPELIDDERIQALLLTSAQRKSLFAELDVVFRTRTTDEWMQRMRAAGQRVARVQDYAEVLEDEMAHENGYLFRAVHPEWGELTLPGSPIWMSDTPLEPGVVPPELGQHTEEVLMELGYSSDEVADLRDRGAWS